jgi:hypothetical protein
MAMTRAQKNKSLRKDSLRELLAEQCRLQHIVENLNKIEQLDETDEFFKNNLDKLKVSNEQRLRLLNKYLPDLKAQEITLGDTDVNSDLARLVQAASNLDD